MSKTFSFGGEREGEPETIKVVDRFSPFPHFIFLFQLLVYTKKKKPKN